jgi:hypothetical protein
MEPKHSLGLIDDVVKFVDEPGLWYQMYAITTQNNEYLQSVSLGTALPLKL